MTRSIAGVLMLLALIPLGCDSDDGSEAGATVTEIVVTDKASGESAAKAEADRASNIKSHIDTSDVVRVLPPTILKDGDVRTHEEGTPARALLEWWQAFQFHDVTTVKRMTGRTVRDTIGPRNLARLVRLTGLQGIEVLGEAEYGQTAVVQVGLLNFAPAAPGEPPPSTPTGSQPATFTMTREDGRWVFDQADYLQLKLNGLNG